MNLHIVTHFGYLTSTYLELENNPYRGLESYEEEHSHLFFGRETLTEELHNKVNNNPLTVVTGYSGIGKSSLLKAGLIPYWKKELKCLNKPHDDLNNLLQQSLENQNLIQKLRELIGKLEQKCNLKFKQSEEKLEDLNKTEQEFNKLQKELENSNRQSQVISNQVVEDKESKNNQKLEELKEQLNKKLEELTEQLSKDLEISKTLWYIKLRIDSDPFQDLENELEKMCIFVSHPQNYNNFQQNEPNLFSKGFSKGLSKGLSKLLNLLTRESETASSNINQENINRKLETWKNLNSDIFGDKRLLIIDQFEEIINLTADKRDKFLSILIKIVTEHQEWLRVVLTMPLDIKYTFQQTSIYEYLTKAKEFFVEEMRREQLRKAIEGPARIQTMYFESHQNGEDLVNKLLDDVGQTPRLLPLVSYTLHELYKKRIEQFKAKEKNVEDPYDRTFTLIDYNNIGGVKNSLVNQIDSKYEEFIDYKGLSSTYQILVKELFLLYLLFRHEIVLCLVFIYCNFKVVYLKANSGSDSLILMKYVLKVMCFIEAEEQKSIREEILSTILDLDEKEKNVDVKIYIYILINMCLPELEKDINNFKRSWENSLTWEKTIKNVMLRMVDIRPLSEITRKRVSISKLEYPDNAENERVKKILKEFKELNFLIEHSSEDNHDSKYVELANDIIKEWKNLKEWIASEEENLRHLRREVEFAADSWNNHKKNEDFLWYNNASYLNKLKKISDSDSNWLNQLENEFLQASLQKQEEVKSEKDNLQKCKEALKKDIIEKQQEINNLKKELEKSNLPNTSEVTAYQKELELLESQAKKYQLQLQQLENELEKSNLPNTSEVTAYQKELIFG
ncbi:MAG: hypothetical protein HEQ10_07005 [Dolichospermum sp. DEX182a]|nr:hypothetical protein [Dolichospermum sp. DEX182a]